MGGLAIFHGLIVLGIAALAAIGAVVALWRAF